MRAVSSKLNTLVEGAMALPSGIEHTALKFILWSFAALALIYVLVLGSMVSNVVARRSSELQARTLESEVTEMELSYLSLSNKVDLDLSHSLGFQEIKPNFTTRKSIGYNSSDSIPTPKDI